MLFVLIFFFVVFLTTFQRQHKTFYVLSQRSIPVYSLQKGAGSTADPAHTRFLLVQSQMWAG